MKSYLVPAAAALAVLVLAPAAFSAKYESNWLDAAITIDGKAPEWAGREVYFDEKDGLKIGFMNDGHYLYVYLSTWHQQIQRQILMRGLTVWFDAKGGKKETFGVSFPLPHSMTDPHHDPYNGEAGGYTAVPGEMQPGPLPERGTESSRNTQEMLKRMLGAIDPNLCVVGAGKEPLGEFASRDTAGNGIEAMIGIANRTLVYELRMPLSPDGSLPLAVQSGPGGKIGVGFKTGSMEKSRMKQQGDTPEGRGEGPGGGGGMPGGGGEFPGGGPSGGGPMGGGMGNHPGGGAEEKSLDLWLKVTLASGAAANGQ